MKLHSYIRPLIYMVLFLCLLFVVHPLYAMEVVEPSSADAPVVASESTALAEPLLAAEPLKEVASNTETPAMISAEPNALSDNGERAANPATPTPDAIYLDGVRGNDDTNDGFSQDKPVKTFAKARELLAAYPTATQIIVIGTVPVEGEVSLPRTDTKVTRGEHFKGRLMEVRKDTVAHFRDIVLNGGGEQEDIKSLVYVAGEMHIHDGAVFEENKIQNTTTTATRGGAIYAYHGTIHMDGGTIRSNQANHGGGVYLYASEMTMTDGAIEENTADRMIDPGLSPTGFYSAGGGVLIDGGSTFRLAERGLIARNHAVEIGGGISVGSNQWSDGKDYLVMTGGTIDGNSAGASGGGVFVQVGYGDLHATAIISAGEITNNVMDGSGVTEKAFGGGGIYVNGVSPQWPGWSYGELHLTNAIITDNMARMSGGGLAACPISKTYVHLTKGAALLGNQARNAKDLYILSVLYYGVHGGEPIYEISERMLGGAPYHWKDESDQLVKPADLKGKLPDGSEIFLHTDETLTDAVRRLGKVLISGNKSTTRGGGIGSNGTVIIGEEGPEKKVEVVKTWEKGLTPAPITVALRAKMDDLDWLIETAELNVANGFKHTFDHLPATVNDQPIESLLYIKETTVSDQYTADVSDIKLVDPEKTFSFKVERPDVSDNESIYAVYGNYYEARPELGMLNDKGELKDFTVYYHLKDKRDGHVISSQGMIYDSEDADRPYPVWQGSILFNDVPMAGEKVVVRYYAPEKEKYFSPVLFAYDIFLDREGDTTVVYMPKIKPSIPVMHGTDTGDEKVLFLEDLAVHNSTEPIFRISVHNKKPSDQPRLREITVVKRWIGDEAPSIEVQLLRNEQLIDQATLTKAQGWRHTFKDLPVNDDKGVAYTYRVAEKAMPGYTPSITWDPQVGFIIVNKKDTPPGTPPGNPPGEPNQRRVYVNKTWLGPAGKEAIIYLLADGEVIDRAVLTESNQWQHIFGQLAKSKDGKRIQYTIKEEPVPGYRSQINGNDRDGF